MIPYSNLLQFNTWPLPFYPSDAPWRVLVLLFIPWFCANLQAYLFMIKGGFSLKRLCNSWTWCGSSWHFFMIGLHMEGRCLVKWSVCCRNLRYNNTVSWYCKSWKCACFLNYFTHALFFIFSFHITMVDVHADADDRPGDLSSTFPQQLVSVEYTIGIQNPLCFVDVFLDVLVHVCWQITGNLKFLTCYLVYDIYFGCRCHALCLGEFSLGDGK